MISDHGDRDFDSTQILIANFASKCWNVTDGDASTAVLPIASRSTTFAREADWVTTLDENLITLCADCHGDTHRSCLKSR